MGKDTNNEWMDVLTLGLSAIRRGVWKAYKYPNKLYITPSYNITTGQGMWSDKGVFTLLFPPTLKHIGKYAFANCQDISQVWFKSQFNTIPEGCFKNCDNLTDVKFVTEEGTTLKENSDLYNINCIEKEAFCKTLLPVTTINKLIYKATEVQDYAFAGSKQACVYGHAEDYSMEQLQQMTGKQAIVIGPQLKKIGAYAFSGSNFFVFKWEDLSDLNIDKNAFSKDFDLFGDYDPYGAVMTRTFVVPEKLKEQYTEFFKTLNLHPSHYRIVISTTDIEEVIEDDSYETEVLWS